MSTTASTSATTTTDPNQKGQEQTSQNPANPSQANPGNPGSQSNPADPSKKQETATVFKTVGKEFKTQEELLEYTKQLEIAQASQALNKDKEKEKEQAASKTMGTLFEPTLPGEPNPDEMFENPVAYQQKLIASVKASIDIDKQKEEGKARYWENFYTKYPHLKNHKRVVDLISGEKWGVLKALPLEDAEKILVRESEGFIASIKSDSKTDTYTPASGTATTTGGNFSSGKKPDQTTKKPTSFVEEMKLAQQARCK